MADETRSGDAAEPRRTLGIGKAVPEVAHADRPANLIDVLIPPCAAHVLFGYGVAAVALLSLLIWGGLQYLAHSVTAASPLFRVAAVDVTAFELFVGNGLILVMVSSVLCYSLAITFCHVRYLGIESRLLGFLGLVLILVLVSLSGLTIYRFYTDPTAFQQRLFQFAALQVMAVFTVLYYCSILHSRLLWELYERTNHVAFHLLSQMRDGGHSSVDGRRRLRDLIYARSVELDQAAWEYNEHLRVLGKASRREE